MKFTTISTGIATILATLASSTPIEAGFHPDTRDLAARATSAQISGYSVTCTAFSCTYTATALLLPENISIAFTTTSAGSAIPQGVLFTSSDPLASLTLTQRSLPGTTYRLVLLFPLGSSPARFVKNWEGVEAPAAYPGNSGYAGPAGFDLVAAP